MPALKQTKKQGFQKHWAVFAIISILSWLLFVHPDIMETANHSYLLLDSLFSGRFFGYYNDVMAHENSLYYINNAHYNIFIYFIFAIAQFPVFVINSIFHLPVNEPLLYFIGKLVSGIFFVGCFPLIHQIGEELSLSYSTSRIAALFFALWPPAFFSALVMGQYDSIGLFFTLAALLYWMRGRMTAFALMTGVAAACKFFVFFMFIPLLLLREKRLVHIVKTGLVSLWLLLPTTLLFMGRTGDMGTFNNIMMSRLFQAKLLGAREIPLFPALYMILCFAAFLWKPAIENIKRTGLWLSLAAYSLFFLLVDWHPQWLILLGPFIILSTMLEKPRVPWFLLDIALCAGFFIFAAVVFPNQLEANLLDFGLVGILTPFSTHQFPSRNAISFYYNLLPMVSALPMVLCGGAFIAQIIFKMPLKGGTPASRLAQGTPATQNWEKNLLLWVWLVFGIGFSIWLLPTLFTWLKTFSLL